MSMFPRSLFLLSFLLLLSACSSVPPSMGRPTGSTGVVSSGSVSFSPEPLTALPDWQQQDLTAALPSLQQSCKVMMKKASWVPVCRSLDRLDASSNNAIRHYFEANFTAWKVRQGGQDAGLITGYYEPIMNGSRSRSSQNPYPLYGVPADLMTLTVSGGRRDGTVVARKVSANRLAIVPGASQAADGQVTVNLADFPAGSSGPLKGRIENGRLQPYYSRADIAAGRGVNTAPVLAWVEDPVELFFLQIQGAGRIQLDDGTIMRVGVGDTNGQPYQSIGRWLADQGEMPLSAASMTGIQTWIRAHPDRQQALFNVNPRYIFFRVVSTRHESGPVGALGVPLTNGYSIAVDPRFIPLGSSVYLATSSPRSSQPLIRMVQAQDTGNAIRGPIRADFFWGLGAEAGINAGRMKQSGNLWLVLPKGVPPPAV